MADAYDINLSVRRLVRMLLGMGENDVRPADQKAAAGSIGQQFATVKIINLDPVGVDTVVNRNDEALPLNVIEAVDGTRHVVASIQIFRGDAYTKAARLPALLRTSAAVEKMQQLGLGFIRAGSPRNLTTQVDTNFEERGQIDIEFYVVAREEISIPTYGEFPVSIDLAVEKPDGNFYPPQHFEVIEP